MHGHFRGKINKDIKCPPKLVLYHSKGGGNFHGVDTNLTSSVLCGWILCAVHGTREVTAFAAELALRVPLVDTLKKCLVHVTTDRL